MIFVGIAVGVFLLDLMIKIVAEKKLSDGRKVCCCKGNVTFTLFHNKGAMLSFMEQFPKALKWMVTGLLGVLLVFYWLILRRKDSAILKLALSLIIGGGLNNLVDRYEKGYVTDYVQFKITKNVVFNLSDLCIFFGGFLIFAVEIFKKK